MSDDVETFHDHDLATSVAAARFRILRMEGEETADRSWQRVTCHLHREDLPWAAVPLAHALGALSFADARPRGVSGNDFDPRDEWRLGDLVSRLRLECLVERLRQGRPDDLVAYLAFASRFRRYSFSNSLLIQMQRPGATRVAGFHACRPRRLYMERPTAMRSGDDGFPSLAKLALRGYSLGLAGCRQSRCVDEQPQDRGGSAKRCRSRGGTRAAWEPRFLAERLSIASLRGGNHPAPSR
jgi:hypothetical protein